jgi:hypothetical protein
MHLFIDKHLYRALQVFSKRSSDLLSDANQLEIDTRPSCWPPNRIVSGRCWWGSALVSVPVFEHRDRFADRADRT